MQLFTLYKDICVRFKERGLDSQDLDARIILEERAGIKRSDLIAHPEKIISRDAMTLIESDVARRLAGEPLSRIYGRREFWSLSFDVSVDTLDPRPDTEMIIIRVLENFPDKAKPISILDLGTGTGCILISLLYEFPNAHGTGIDLSFGAAKTARQNAMKNNVADRAGFICGSWAESLHKKFDLIVSNPPYIRSKAIPDLMPEVQNHDPILALDGGKDGLEAYRIIFSSLKNNLVPGGTGIFEIGFDQENDVMRLAEESGFSMIRSFHDFAGQPRVVEISNGDK